MKIKNFKCTQCGASDFKKQEDPNLVRCAYCNSLYEIEPGSISNSTNVIIGKGAKIVIGKSANVFINGNVEVEDGAEIEINGNITIKEKSSDEQIEIAKKNLNKIEE